MTFELKQAYSEVFIILQHMPREYIEKIPSKIYKMFEREKIEGYKLNVNQDNLLNKEVLSKKTIVLIAILNYMYWCPSPKVRKSLHKQYLANNEIYNEKLWNFLV